MSAIKLAISLLLLGLLIVVVDSLERIVFKIEDVAPVPATETHYREFKSNACYIVGDESKVTGDVSVHYWIGEDSPINEGGLAAHFAMQMDSIRHETVKLRREAEGHESYIFKKLFEPEEETDPMTVDEADKRLYIIYEKKNKLGFHEVALISDLVTEGGDKCAVFISDRVYVHCNFKSSNKQKRAAKELAAIILEKRGRNREEMIVINRNRNSNCIVSYLTRCEVGDENISWFGKENHRLQGCFKPLKYDENDFELPLRLPIEEIEWFNKGFLTDLHGCSSENAGKSSTIQRPDEFTAQEKQRILKQEPNYDDTSFRPEIFRITELHGMVFEIPVAFTEARQTDWLNRQKTYLIDSKNDAGIFVLFNRDADKAFRREVARLAEVHLRMRKYNYTTPITYVEERDLSLKPIGIMDFIYLMGPPSAVSQMATEIDMTDDMPQSSGRSEETDEAGETTQNSADTDEMDLTISHLNAVVLGAETTQNGTESLGAQPVIPAINDADKEAQPTTHV